MHKKTRKILCFFYMVFLENFVTPLAIKKGLLYNICWYALKWEIAAYPGQGTSMEYVR